MNVPKLKGTHTAMKSGIIAAECVYDAIANDIATSNTGTWFLLSLGSTNYLDLIYIKI